MQNRQIISKVIKTLSAMFSIFFESMAGRNIFLGALFLLFFSMIYYDNTRMILPKTLEDTVGDIPIIEHFDDGSVEVVDTPRDIVYRDRIIYRDRYTTDDGSFVTGAFVTGEFFSGSILTSSWGWQ